MHRDAGGEGQAAPPYGEEDSIKKHLAEAALEMEMIKDPAEEASKSGPRLQNLNGSADVGGIRVEGLPCGGSKPQ